jgi:hypothetical protein
VSEETAKLLSWLVYIRVLALVTKPPEIAAFQTATQHYRYRDPWEVTPLIYYIL